MDSAWLVPLALVVGVAAGAGIVGASLPEAELAETDAKMRAMLRGLGLADSGDPAPPETRRDAGASPRSSKPPTNAQSRHP